MSLRASGRSLFRASAPSPSSSSICGFCTSAAAASKPSSPISSRKAKDLSPIISLYQSSSSFPVVSSPSSSSSSPSNVAPLQHYVDSKLLHRTKLQALNVQSITNGLSSSRHNRSSDDRESEIERPSYRYMYDDMDTDFSISNGRGEPDEFSLPRNRTEALSFNPMDLSSFSSRRGGTARQVWKPLSNSASKGQKERGRRIVDALSGTVDARFPGKGMVKEAWGVMEKRVEELLSRPEAGSTRTENAEGEAQK